MPACSSWRVVFKTPAGGVFTAVEFGQTLGDLLSFDGDAATSIRSKVRSGIKSIRSRGNWSMSMTFEVWNDHASMAAMQAFMLTDTNRARGYALGMSAEIENAGGKHQLTDCALQSHSVRKITRPDKFRTSSRWQIAYGNIIPLPTLPP